MFKKKTNIFEWKKDKGGSLWTCEPRDDIDASVILTDSFSFQIKVWLDSNEIFNNDGFESKGRAMIEAEAFMKDVIDGTWKVKDDPKNDWKKKLEAIQ